MWVGLGRRRECSQRGGGCHRERALVTEQREEGPRDPDGVMGWDTKPEQQDGSAPAHSAPLPSRTAVFQKGYQSSGRRQRAALGSEETCRLAKERTEQLARPAHGSRWKDTSFSGEFVTLNKSLYRFRI